MPSAWTASGRPCGEPWRAARSSGRRLSGCDPCWFGIDLVHEIRRAPDPLGDCAIEVLARIEVGFLEVGVCDKGDPRLLAEPLEARVVVVGLLVEALSEKV